MRSCCSYPLAADADGDHFDRVAALFADADRLFQRDRVERIDHERNVLDGHAAAVAAATIF